jgi:ribosomal-protein-alanine N-acetyltransferase
LPEYPIWSENSGCELLMNFETLEFHQLKPEWGEALYNFFLAIKDDTEYFHPHPFTQEYAYRLSLYQGEDIYYITTDGREIVAYGLLRGWDEGFEMPSLGVAIHPKLRGTGLSKLFIFILHHLAKMKGAKKIRLKVYSNNIAAVKLYQNIGYEFISEENGQLLGVIQL